MNTLGKILNNRIGQVEVVELLGKLKGTTSRQFHMDMYQHFTQLTGKFSILFNAQGLEAIDDYGVQAVLETARLAEKCAVMTRDTRFVEMLLTEPKSFVRIFDNMDQVVGYLKAELIPQELDSFSERRKFVRLPVALNVRVYFPESHYSSQSFAMVASNLSLHGMFLKFIDSSSEILVRKSIHLYERSPIEFLIKLSDEDVVLLNGRIVHINPITKGIGVEFTEMTPSDRALLTKHVQDLMEK